MKQIIIFSAVIFFIILFFAGCDNDDASITKSEWLTDFFDEIEEYDDIYAVSYWNENFDNTYFKINSSEESLNTFKKLISKDCYISKCKFENNKLQISEGKKYFAAFPDFCGEEDCVSEQRIFDFENLAGKEISWAYFSDNWGDSLIFPSENVAAIINAGRVPFIRLMPRSEFEENQADPIWNLKDIIDGKHDEMLIAWAEEAKNTGINLPVEFGTEMNGSWFSWNGIYYGGGNTGGYGNTDYPDGPEIFRDAYRHIIDICNETGADNITWFFHFDVSSDPDEDWNNPVYYYPGDDYIDWLGVSIYGPYTENEADDENLLPQYLVPEAYRKFKEISGTKPYAVLEFGVTEL
ncbi:MAG: hypothetical protein GXO50_05725 [Chlorobi bacterium]|nr:hypothetical protein [Chlorobiota bacterium]